MFGSAPLASEGFGVLADGFRVVGGRGEAAGREPSSPTTRSGKGKKRKKKEEEELFLPGFHVKVC